MILPSGLPNFNNSSITYSFRSERPMEADLSRYRARKGRTPRPPARPEDIFVTRKSNRRLLVRRAEDALLRQLVSGAKKRRGVTAAAAADFSPSAAAEASGSVLAEVCFHGMGAAVEPCVDVANEVVRHGNEARGIEVDAAAAAPDREHLRTVAQTSTVQLVDELEPIDGTVDEPLLRVRNNSAIHVRVQVVAPQGSASRAPVDDERSGDG